MIFLATAVCIAFIYQMYTYSLSVLELRTSKRKVQLGTVFVFSLVGIIFVIGSQNYYILSYGIITFLMYVYFKRCYQTTSLMAIYAANNYLLHILCIRSVVFTILAFAFDKSIYQFSSNNLYYSFGVFVTYAIANVVLVLFRKHYSDQLQKSFMQNRKELKLMVLIQFTINFFLMLANFIHYLYNINDPVFLSFSFITYTIISMAFYVVYDYSIGIAEVDKLKEQVIDLEDQLERQLNQYQQMSEYIINFRKLRHDYKFILKGIYAQLEIGDLAKAKRFLTDVEGELDSINSSYAKYSNHPLLQALLSDFASICQKKDIQFEATLIMPSKIEFNDMELCRVFSNLITNAVEACEKLPKEAKAYINIKSKNNNPWLSILIENNYNHTLNTNYGKLETTKEDKTNHGLGLQNVQNIIEKYGGLYSNNIDEKNGIFKTILNLPME